MTYIRFFLVLYWFAPFLKFGPLPSENPRCATDEKTEHDYTRFKFKSKVKTCNKQRSPLKVKIG